EFRPVFQASEPNKRSGEAFLGGVLGKLMVA
ncbi:unnamed protein product, partial [marine sediment metagenome]